jgi:hypothetical protein
MSDPQQPQNWQWQQGGGQPQPGGQWQQPGGPWQQQPGGQWPPQPGAQPPGYQVPPPFLGYDQPAPRRKRRLLPWIIVAAVIFVGAGVALAVHAFTSPKGSISLPSTLLGLHKATSSSADRLANDLVRAESKNSHGRLSGIKAGVYGAPQAEWVAVAGGGICGTCTAKSASALESSLRSSGYSNVASFPAGPNGGALACGEKAAGSTTLLHCTWVDGKTAGDTLLAGGAALDPVDAAAKTNEIRAAVER